MFGLIRNIVRRNRLKKYASDIETGLLPMSQIGTVNVVIDVEEPGFDELKDEEARKRRLLRRSYLPPSYREFYDSGRLPQR